jgi:hypothetical protein
MINPGFVDMIIPGMDEIVEDVGLEELDQRIDLMLTGKHNGRVVVNVND